MWVHGSCSCICLWAARSVSVWKKFASDTATAVSYNSLCCLLLQLSTMLLEDAFSADWVRIRYEGWKLDCMQADTAVTVERLTKELAKALKWENIHGGQVETRPGHGMEQTWDNSKGGFWMLDRQRRGGRGVVEMMSPCLMEPSAPLQAPMNGFVEGRGASIIGKRGDHHGFMDEAAVDGYHLDPMMGDVPRRIDDNGTENFRAPMGQMGVENRSRRVSASSFGREEGFSYTLGGGGGGATFDAGGRVFGNGGAKDRGAEDGTHSSLFEMECRNEGGNDLRGGFEGMQGSRRAKLAVRRSCIPTAQSQPLWSDWTSNHVLQGPWPSSYGADFVFNEEDGMVHGLQPPNDVVQEQIRMGALAAGMLPPAIHPAGSGTPVAGVDTGFPPMGFGIPNGGYGGGEQTVSLGMGWIMDQHVETSRMSAVPGGDGMAASGGRGEGMMFADMGATATNNRKETIDLTQALSNVDLNGTEPDLMVAASRGGWLEAGPMADVPGSCELGRFSAVGPLEQELRQGIGLSCRWNIGNGTEISEGDFIGGPNASASLPVPVPSGSVASHGADQGFDMAVGGHLAAFSESYGERRGSQREQGADIAQRGLGLEIPESRSRRTSVLPMLNNVCDADETGDDGLQVGTMVGSPLHTEMSKRASVSAQNNNCARVGGSVMAVESSDVMDMSVCQGGSGRDMEEMHGESRESRSPEKMAFLDCLLASDGTEHERSVTGNEKGDGATLLSPGSSGKHGMTPAANGTKVASQKKLSAPICEGITAMGRRCSHRSKPGAQFCEKHKQGNKAKEESGLILIANAIATVAETVSSGAVGLDNRGRTSVGFDSEERTKVPIGLDLDERARANGSVDPAARALIMASTGAPNLEEEADAESGGEHLMSGAIVVYEGEPDDLSAPAPGALLSQPVCLSEEGAGAGAGDDQELEDAVAGLERLEGMAAAAAQSGGGEGGSNAALEPKQADWCQGMTLLGRPCKHRAKPGQRFCEKHKGSSEEKATNERLETDNIMEIVPSDISGSNEVALRALPADDDNRAAGGDGAAGKLGQPLAIEDGSKGEDANASEDRWALAIVPFEMDHTEKQKPVSPETEQRKKHNKPPEEPGRSGRVEGEPPRKVEVCRGITMAGVGCKQRVRQGTTYCDWHVGQAGIEEEGGSPKVMVVSRRQENEKGGRGMMVEKLCEGTTLLGKQCTHRAKPLSRFCEKHNPPSQKNDAEEAGEQENNCTSAAEDDVLDTTKTGCALIQAAECASREVVAVEQAGNWKDMDPQFCIGITLFGSQCSHRPRPGTSFCVKHNPESSKRSSGAERALVCLPLDDGPELGSPSEREVREQLDAEGAKGGTEGVQEQAREEEEREVVRVEVAEEDAVAGRTNNGIGGAADKDEEGNQGKGNGICVDTPGTLRRQRKRKATDDIDGCEDDSGGTEVFVSRQNDGDGGCSKGTEEKKRPENKPTVCVGITKENRRCTHHAMRKKLYCRKHLKKVKRTRANSMVVIQQPATAEETAATLMEMTRGRESAAGNQIADKGVVVINGNPSEPEEDVPSKKRKASEVGNVDATLEAGQREIKAKALEIFAGFIKAVKEGPKDGPAFFPGPFGEGHRMVFESNLLDKTFTMAEKRLEVCEELLVLVAEEQTKMLKGFERSYGKDWVQLLLRRTGEAGYEWRGGDSLAEVNGDTVSDKEEGQQERGTGLGEVLSCEKLGRSSKDGAKMGDEAQVLENGAQREDASLQKLVADGGQEARRQELAALGGAVDETGAGGQVRGEVARATSTTQQKKRKKKKGSSGRGGSGGENQSRKKLRCRSCGAEFEILYEMLLHWRAMHMEAKVGSGGKKSKKQKEKQGRGGAGSGGAVNSTPAKPSVMVDNTIRTEAEVDKGAVGSSVMTANVDAREPSGGPCAEIEDEGRNNDTGASPSSGNKGKAESKASGSRKVHTSPEGVKNNDTDREWRYTCRECGMKFDLLPDLGRHFKAKHIDRQVPPSERKKRDRKRKRCRPSTLEGKHGSKPNNGTAPEASVPALASGNVRAEGARKRKPTWKVLESDHPPDGVLEAVLGTTESERRPEEGGNGTQDGDAVVQEAIAEQLVKLAGWPEDSGRGEEAATVGSLLCAPKADIKQAEGCEALNRCGTEGADMANKESAECALIDTLEDGDDKQLEAYPAKKRLKDMARGKLMNGALEKEVGSEPGGQDTLEPNGRVEGACGHSDDLMVVTEAIDSVGKMESVCGLTGAAVKASMRKLARCRGDGNGTVSGDLHDGKAERENGVLEVTCTEPAGLQRVSLGELAEIAKDSCCKWSMFEVLMERQGKVPDKIAVKANRACCEKGWTISWYKRGYRCPNGCKAAYLKKHRPKNGLMPSGEKAVNREPDEDEDDVAMNGDDNGDGGCRLQNGARNGACTTKEVVIAASKAAVRIEGEGKDGPPEGGDVAQETKPQAARKEIVRRRVLCPDMSFGQETLPIPCIVDETDDDEDADLSCILRENNCHANGNGAGAQNGPQAPTSADLDTRPWESFTYATKRKLDPTLGVDTANSQVACACSGARCLADSCEHVRLFNQDNIEACDIDGELMLDKFPYDERGCIVLQEKYMVYECSPMCMCSDECQNRVLQKGVRVKLEVYRTKHKGWAVRAAEAIPRGTFVCEYIGEVVNDREANRRGERYDQVGCSYLYDIDVHLDPPAYRNRARPFVIDATKYGNVSRFINHSCQPNLVNYQVLVESMDVRLAHVGLYANCDIQAGDELAFDYRYKLLPGKGCPCYCGAPKEGSQWGEKQRRRRRRRRRRKREEEEEKKKKKKKKKKKRGGGGGEEEEEEEEEEKETEKKKKKKKKRRRKKKNLTLKMKNTKKSLWLWLCLNVGGSRGGGGGGEEESDTKDEKSKTNRYGYDSGSTGSEAEEEEKKKRMRREKDEEEEDKEENKKKRTRGEKDEDMDKEDEKKKKRRKEEEEEKKKMKGRRRRRRRR
ncbi:hypothetical protein CBR_g22240 [Chara braunii]|uniref:C2H2-type domain-containing protein n=1 Tax=Chara braunii TaxID=69332 RepID=A0A388L2G7_CHABU|nr:hypothetical protein CBR_g22240 [Chara braunii]|eukprot:GBG76491.1 hypothetical protein CBR_g22240 [Chara braunii]